MDEVVVIVGLVLDQKGNSIEWWLEGYSMDAERAEDYADRLNRIHEKSGDEDEHVRYVTASALSIESQTVFDGDYDA